MRRQTRGGDHGWRLQKGGAALQLLIFAPIASALRPRGSCCVHPAYLKLDHRDRIVLPWGVVRVTTGRAAPVPSPSAKPGPACPTVGRGLGSHIPFGGDPSDF